MTRFVTRLVERAKGRAPVVRPVLPARFEKGLTEGVELEESLLETQVTLAPRTPSLPAPPLTAATAVEEVAAEPAERVPPPLVAEAGEPPQRAQPSPEAEISAEPARPRVAVAEEPTPVVVELHVDRTPEPPPSALRVKEAPPQRAAPSRRLQAAPPSPESPRPAPSPERAEPSLFTAAEPPPAPARAAAQLPQLAVAPLRSSAPMAAAQRQLAMAAREPEAQVVHVSIGRIDVRAVTPPAPAAAQPRRAATPRLSLEEHLKMRDGDR